MKWASVAMLLAAVPCCGLGYFVGIAHPRHGSEVVGYPLLLLGAGLWLGGIASLWRPRRSG